MSGRVRLILGVLCLLVAAVGAVLTATGEAHGAARVTATARVIHTCVEEDGSGGPLPCVWDARHQGDGRGRSLYFTRDGRVLIIRHAVAHRLAVRAGR